MNSIKVAVHGAVGKVGREVINAVCREPGLDLVGAVDMNISTDQLPLPDGSGTIPFSADLDALLSNCPTEVIVDFSNAKATMPAVRTATKHKVNMVIGTTGISADNLNEIEQLATANNVGIVVAPNFALGAVVMIHLAKIAAKYFDYAEIIELHHHQKIDAPSGTALSTAQAMAESKGEPFTQPPEQEGASESRGKHVSGVAIHSVRLPGLMAHQEIILGTSGQTLSIRHDTINRECYMPGVIMAIKEVVKQKGLIYGLDKILGL